MPKPFSKRFSESTANSLARRSTGLRAGTIPSSKNPMGIKRGGFLSLKSPLASISCSPSPTRCAMRITPRSPSSCFSSGATSTRDSCPSARPTSRISASVSALPKCAPPPLALPASEHTAERHHPASLAETFSKPHFCRVCFPSITSFSGSSAAPISNWKVAESGEICLNVNRPRAAFPSILPSLFQVHVPPSALRRAVIYTLHASLESLTALPAPCRLPFQPRWPPSHSPLSALYAPGRPGVLLRERLRRLQPSDPSQTSGYGLSPSGAVPRRPGTESLRRIPAHPRVTLGQTAPFPRPQRHG